MLNGSFVVDELRNCTLPNGKYIVRNPTGPDEIRHQSQVTVRCHGEEDGVIARCEDGRWSERLPVCPYKSKFLEVTENNNPSNKYIQC